LADQGPVRRSFRVPFVIHPGSTLWTIPGAYIDACRLAESNAVYSIEIKTKSGVHLRRSMQSHQRHHSRRLGPAPMIVEEYTNHSFVSFFISRSLFCARRSKAAAEQTGHIRRLITPPGLAAGVDARSPCRCACPYGA